MPNDSLAASLRLGTSELSRQATRAELDDWNDRVRRLARAYAPKYRPLVLSLGYHVNLGEGLGRTYIKVETIVKESARYTASGKPLQVRYVKRLLAEMQQAGALKAEMRYREDTGRQTSSYRTLVTSLSMDRHGFTRAHDFWAPFDESSQLDEKKDSPRDTPQDTPRDTRTDFELACELEVELAPNYPADAEVGTSNDSSIQSQDQGPSAPHPAGAEDPGISPWNVFYFWETPSGSWAVFCAAEADMSKVPGRATEVILDGDETRFFHEALHYQDREQKALFLSLSHAERLEYCAGYAEDGLTPQERAERDEAAAAEDRLRDEILSSGVFREGFTPKFVRLGVGFRRSCDGPGLVGVWHHPEHDLTIWSDKSDLNPGPGWVRGNALERDMRDTERIQLRAE